MDELDLRIRSDVYASFVHTVGGASGYAGDFWRLR